MPLLHRLPSDEIPSSPRGVAYQRASVVWRGGCGAHFGVRLPEHSGASYYRHRIVAPKAFGAGRTSWPSQRPRAGSQLQPPYRLRTMSAVVSSCTYRADRTRKMIGRGCDGA
jgi:hypothetical protein